MRFFLEILPELCRIVRRGIATVLHVLAGMTLLPAVRPSAPPQPRSGPGGADYAFDSVKAHLYKEDGKFWIFEPADPKPETAPLVVFNHGYGATEPRTYGAWIDHLVKRGKIVVYPAYQERLIELPGSLTSSRTRWGCSVASFCSASSPENALLMWKASPRDRCTE